MRVIGSIPMQNSEFCGVLLSTHIIPLIIEEAVVPRLCSSNLGGAWCLTYATKRLEKLSFFKRNSYVGHPRFHSFRALGSLHFFLENSFEFSYFIFK